MSSRGLTNLNPFLVPLTVPLLMLSSPFAMHLGSHTSRQNGTFIQTSPPSAGLSWTWSTSSSGRQSLWFMMTALVRPQTHVFY
uniref:Secreted protein n=1 Tax=Amphilophus citrinellus TaxID=61819 RepID=A0A3Q0SYE9_AMPCI